jgi:hypothetical protein
MERNVVASRARRLLMLKTVARIYRAVTEDVGHPTSGKPHSIGWRKLGAEEADFADGSLRPMPIATRQKVWR